MRLWHTNKELIGLDIGSWSIKAIHLQREEGRYVLRAIGYGRIAADVGDSVPSEAATLSAVRACIRDVGSPEVGLICGLSGESVVVRSFRFSPLPATEIAGAVRLEAMQVCPFSVEDSALSLQVLTEGDHQHAGIQVAEDEEEPVRGIFSVATNEAVQHKANWVSRAGRTCRLMDVNGLAHLNAILTLRAQDATGPVAVLDLGHGYTTVAIGQAGTLPFIRDIPFAGRAVLETVCAKTQLTPADVGPVLFGGSLERENAKAIQLAITSAAEELSAHIAETLRFHVAQQGQGAIQAVYVCGGLAHHQVLYDQLRQRLTDYTLKLWNPFDSIEVSDDLKETECLQQGPAFAAAVGLALRTL